MVDIFCKCFRHPLHKAWFIHNLDLLYIWSSGRSLKYLSLSVSPLYYQPLLLLLLLSLSLSLSFSLKILCTILVRKKQGGCTGPLDVIESIFQTFLTSSFSFFCKVFYPIKDNSNLLSDVYFVVMLWNWSDPKYHRLVKIWHIYLTMKLIPNDKSISVNQIETIYKLFVKNQNLFLKRG